MLLRRQTPFDATIVAASVNRSGGQPVEGQEGHTSRLATGRLTRMTAARTSLSRWFTAHVATHVAAHTVLKVPQPSANAAAPDERRVQIESSSSTASSTAILAVEILPRLNHCGPHRRTGGAMLPLTSPPSSSTCTPPDPQAPISALHYAAGARGTTICALSGGLEGIKRIRGSL